MQTQRRRGKGQLSLTERFWAKVAKAGPDDCWLWIAYKTDGGYGMFGLGRKILKAHRVAFTLTNPLDPDQQVLHRCDVPACVNPNHLYAGTRSDNMRDAYARGRLMPKRGEQNGRAKLTQVKVAEIRRLYAEIGLSQRKIARMYGTSQIAIWRVVNRKTWM